MNWSHLARDRDEQPGTCEHGTEPSGPKNRGISRTAEQLLIFQERFCTMELVNKYGKAYSITIFSDVLTTTYLHRRDIQILQIQMYSC